MISSGAPPAAAYADVVLLIGLAPSSLSPMSIPEMHLYAYLGNLIAFSQGQPVADWGYSFFVTAEGFPFSGDLEKARQNLVSRSIIIENQGKIIRDDHLFQPEFELMLELTQSNRRKIWQKTSLACGLHMPPGAVRHAINNSPGVAVNLQQGRVGTLMKEADLDQIHEEFSLIREFLGEKDTDMLQPAILWLSARVLSGK